MSAETQRLVEQLKQEGYAIYDLVGKTPVTLRTEGMSFRYINPGLENASTLPSLVAFRPNPSEFFLKGSQGIPYEAQLNLLKKEQERVEKQYPGASLVARVGKPSEWAEVAYEHFKATDGRVRIFGRDYVYISTWTDAYESDEPGADRAAVGNWHETDGLHVNFALPDGVHPRLGLASLVEIPRK